MGPRWTMTPVPAGRWPHGLAGLGTAALKVAAAAAARVVVLGAMGMGSSTKKVGSLLTVAEKGGSVSMAS